jgi:thiol-disulfide isomerase/thioredoxin
MENNVTVLTKDNLESYMSEPHLLVVYVAEWCGACKRIIPKLYQLNPKWKVVIVDAERYFKSHTFFPGGIEFYPTMAYFERGYFMGEIHDHQIVQGDLEIQ